MENKNTNPTQFCFPAEALQKYFVTASEVEEFARAMRHYNQEVAEFFLAKTEVPTAIAQGVAYLNSFVEALSPYFTKP